MTLEQQILAAVLLDLLAGDPRWLPHPVRAMGRLAAVLETGCRRFISREAAAGTLAAGSLLAAVGAAALGLLRVAGRLDPWAEALLGVYFLYTAIAARDLLCHSLAVHRALAAGDLPEARRRVGYMVGRDTAELDAAGVARAAVESVAENLVDGITAPLFYAFLGGPVGAMLYRAVNTMDSMFGYKNARYLRFGRAAARLDDLANFLPARLTALLIPPAAGLLGLGMRDSWRVLRRDRLQHASPNSGHPEAAVAGALGLELGGPAAYGGQTLCKPRLGNPSRPIAPAHILQANRLVLLAAFLFLLILVGGRALLAPAG